MSFKVDFSKFKKLAEDKTHTVMSHEDGHELKIAHGSLSPSIRKQLAKLPVHQEGEAVHMADGGSVPDVDPKKAEKFVKDFNKPFSFDEAVKNLKEGFTLGDKKPKKMAAGGEVDEEEDGQTSSLNFDPKKLQSLEDASSKYGAEDTGPMAAPLEKPAEISADTVLPESGFSMDEISGGGDPFLPKEPTPSKVPGEAGWVPTEQDIAQLNPTPQPATPTPQPTAQAPAPQALPSTLDGYNKQIDAIRKEGDVQAAAAKQQEAEFAAKATAANDLLTKYETRAKELNDERSALSKDIDSKHIDPNRYLGSQDTFGRMMTAVGLVLGGLGGGGNGNQALDLLNKQIDRDIDAQKAEIGKKETLLSANLKEFGNLKDATDMTRVMQQDMLLSRMKQIEAGTNSQTAKLRAQQFIGQLEAQAGTSVQKIATSQLLNAAQKEAEKDPSKMGAFMELAEKADPKKAADLRERAIPGMGWALTKEDAKDIKELKGTVESAKSGIQELLKLSDEPGAAMNPKTRARAQTIKQTLVGALRVPITGPGAMNEGEREMLENIIADPTSVFSLSMNNKAKLGALRERLNTSVDEIAKSRGVNITGANSSAMSNLTPQQKLFAVWARNNPNDKKSAMILKKLGIE